VRFAATFGVLWALGLSGRAYGLQLTRGPYLGWPDDRSVSISWSTDTPSTSRVDCLAPDGTRLSVFDAAPVQKHVVSFPSLAPGAVYCYSVLSDDQVLVDGLCFRAPRAPLEEGFRFAVVGDTDGGTIPALIASRLVLEEPDLVIHTGDVVYPQGAEAGYDEQFFGPFAPWLARGPVLPAIGNHDAETDRAGPLLANFVLPVNGVTPDSRFYAFRQGSVLFVCLDDETSAYGKGSPQFEWLVQTLSASEALWKVVYFHEPPFSSDHSNVEERVVLSPVFEQFGVDVVFTGHAHLYERTRPIRLYAASGPGVLYVTEGGGGASLSSVHRIPESAFVSACFGYLIVDVDGRTLSMTAHEVDGTVFDSVILEKLDDPGASRPKPRPSRSRPSASVAKDPS